MIMPLRRLSGSFRSPDGASRSAGDSAFDENTSGGPTASQKAAPDIAELVLVRDTPGRPGEKSVEVYRQVNAAAGSGFTGMPDFGDPGTKDFHKSLDALTKQYADIDSKSGNTAEVTKKIEALVKQENSRLGGKGTVKFEIEPVVNPDGSSGGFTSKLTQTRELSQQEANDYLQSLQDKTRMRDVIHDIPKSGRGGNEGAIVEARATGDDRAVKQMIDRLNKSRDISRSLPERNDRERSRAAVR